MIRNETKVRVRYGETDQMGYCYYGVYAQYYEIGRTELMRKSGISYKEFENQGFMMPVLSFNINYLKPAVYDDELTIVTILEKLPMAKIEFKYEVYNQYNELLNVGEVKLVFVKADTRKPTRAPIDLMKRLAEFF